MTPIKQTQHWKFGIACFSLFVAGSLFPDSLAAQSQLNQQQMTGRRLFMQNCALCHLARPDNVKSSEAGSAYGGELKGLFQGPAPMTDQAVQAFIMQGLPKKMPGFQYSLKSEDINNIISYLKTL